MAVTDTDWNAEWTRLSDAREAAHDAAFWDKRAADFRGGDEASPYVAGFIERMRLLPGESVLDAGSGPGTLALPLARAGHDVCALDFSPAMLAALQERAAELGLANVRTVLASWDDDWRAAGAEPAGVAVASRSLDVRDLRAALEKLEAFAHRRVCITLPADGLLYPSLLAREALGRPVEPRGDAGLAVKVLGQMGVAPEVSYLERASRSQYDSRESALEALRRMVRPDGDAEERALERYVAGHVVAAAGAGGRRVWMQSPAITVRWAFIAWDTSSGSRRT